jgi:hypothetical protein
MLLPECLRLVAGGGRVMPSCEAVVGVTNGCERFDENVMVRAGADARRFA